MPDQLKYEIFEARRAKIIAISELCKKDPLYKKTEAQRDAFYRPLKNVTREKAFLMSWVHMLDRMLKAPTKVHMRGAIVLCFPILGDLLKKK